MWRCCKSRCKRKRWNSSRSCRWLCRIQLRRSDFRRKREKMARDRIHRNPERLCCCPDPFRLRYGIRWRLYRTHAVCERGRYRKLKRSIWSHQVKQSIKCPSGGLSDRRTYSRLRTASWTRCGYLEQLGNSCWFLRKLRK